MTDCIFCGIATGAIPATTVHRDESTVAIEDINPQAPTHLLVFPVAHVPSVAQLDSTADAALIAHLVRVATALGRKHGGNDGFRLVVNTGPHGGQTVDHVHVHVLAGRHMEWPPG